MRTMSGPRVEAPIHMPMKAQCKSVSIPAGSGAPMLPAELTVPYQAKGVVLFAHGSGTRRDDPRDRLVATRLHEAGLATLLMDPLDEHEARDRHNLFDEELIATRLAAAARWLAAEPATHTLPLGYFGADTGAAGALIAAAREPEGVAAVVSRGGRPDIALSWLHRVRAPTLLIVGERDETGLDWNKDAYQRIKGDKALVLVPGATHLFGEPGALEETAEHALRWFVRHLRAPLDVDADQARPGVRA